MLLVGSTEANGEARFRLFLLATALASATFAWLFDVVPPVAGLPLGAAPLLAAPGQRPGATVRGFGRTEALVSLWALRR